MGVKNLQAFERVINDSVKELTEEQLPLFQRKLTLDVLASIVQKTPVDTGRARNNWQTEIGKQADGVLSASKQGRPVQRANTKLQGIRPFEAVNITNNLEYIVPLEEGHSKQAPKGMVSLTLAEITTNWTAPKIQNTKLGNVGINFRL